jgi:hypothetical protein
MSAGTLVSLEEYLNTTYEPDLDYVDGKLRDRNADETGHSKIQLEVGHRLRVMADTIPMQVMTEARPSSASKFVS